MEIPTQALSLSGLELVYLTDSISNKDIAEGLSERDAYVPLARQALLLLGSAYRELVSLDGVKEGPVTIEISEEMAWLLRSKVRTGDLAIDGKTNIGVPLLLKLYEILSSFDTDIAGLPPVVARQEAKLSERDREYLETLKESANARREPNDHTNSDASA